MSAAHKSFASAAAAAATQRNPVGTVAPFHEPLVVKVLPSGRQNRGAVAPILDAAAWGVMTEAQCKARYAPKWFVPIYAGRDEDMYELHDAEDDVESSYWICVTDAARVWRTAKKNHKPAWKNVYEDEGLVYGAAGRTSIESVCIACLGSEAADYRAAELQVWAAVTLPATWTGERKGGDVEPLLSEFLRWKAPEDCPATDMGEDSGKHGRKLKAFMTGEHQCVQRCAGLR